MKKVITMLLAVCLVLGLSVGVFAATMTPAVDKTAVKAGESVIVTVSLDEDITDALSVAYRLYYDASLFDLTDSENLCVGGFFTASEPKTDSASGKTYINFSSMDATSQGQTLKAGNIIKLTLKAKADVSEQNTAFTAEFENAMNSSFGAISGLDAGPAATVTVKPAASSTSAYTAAVSGTTEIKVGENAVVDVTVSSDDETSFNAYALTLTYDANVLTYKNVSPAAQKVTDNNGTLTILDYGADKNVGGKIAITFEGKAGGKSEVKLTEARVDKSANAAVQDAPKADIATASATITVSASYSVTLPTDEFTGAETAELGKDYTFTAKNKNYNYTFTDSTMGGDDVTVEDNGDGTYTVKNVTGNLDIKIASKTGKTYTVSYTSETDCTEYDGEPYFSFGNLDPTTATYGKDLSFCINDPDEATYIYTVQVTIGGKAYTGFTQTKDLAGGYIVKIPGSDITGDIVVKVFEKNKPSTSTAVSITGGTFADGNTSATPENGKDYSFSIKKETGFTYTVKAMQDGAEIPVTENSDGIYTIAAQYMNGKAITIRVTKSADITVAVSEYLKLSGKNVYLITVAGTAGEGKAFAYDGAVMYTSEEYGAAAYLVIADKAPTVAEAKAKVAAVDAVAEAIVYGGDVNGTGKVDVNDAQLVYDLYNAKYDSFTSVSMLKFLRADVSGDKTVNTNDAAAVINLAR